MRLAATRPANVSPLQVKTGNPAHKHVSGWGPLYTPFNEVMETSDVITLHSPLVAATRNMIGYAEFQQMKRKPIIVNTSRGGIVDEAALAAALQSGRLGGAALDVFEAEPLAPANPFAGCPNLLLTPHIAGVSAEANERVSLLIAERVLEALR